MNKYVFCVTGCGEGCDYTIGCNVKFEIEELKDDKAALKYARELYDDHGGASRIENIEIFVSSREISVPVDEWAEKDEEEQEEREAREALEEAEDSLREAKAKLDKIKKK